MESEPAEEQRSSFLPAPGTRERVSSGRLGGGLAPSIDSVGGTHLELKAEAKITTKRALASRVSSFRARVVENVGGGP